MKFTKHIPEARLSPLVAHYWSLSASEEEAGTHFRFVPDGFVDWIFHEKTPWAYRYESESGAYNLHQNHILGHTKRFIDLNIEGEMQLFGVKFNPESAHWIWGEGMHETSDISLSADDFQNQVMSDLADQLVDQATTGDRVKLCDRILAEALASSSIGSGEHRLKQAMSEPASLQVGQRRVEQIFKEKVGIGTVTMRKTKRINSAIQSLWNRGTKSLTEVAYDLGYFDQAHFIREVKTFTGMTPGKFLKSINPDGEIWNLKAG